MYERNKNHAPKATKSCLCIYKAPTKEKQSIAFGILFFAHCDHFKMKPGILTGLKYCMLFKLHLTHIFYKCSHLCQW